MCQTFGEPELTFELSFLKNLYRRMCLYKFILKSCFTILKVLKTPDFQNCKAAEEIRESKFPGKYLVFLAFEDKTNCLYVHILDPYLTSYFSLLT